MLRELWGHRAYILGGAVRELRQRYAGSGMGLVWHVLTPLAQIVVYFIVFSRFIGSRAGGVYSAPSYAVYLCAGILPWFVFSECINRGATSLLANENYLKKLAIPEPVFVAQTVATSGLTLIIYTVALGLMAFATGVPVRWTWLLVPVVLALFLALGFGLALILATMTVFFRDIVHVIDLVLQIWFWITPVVYDVASLGPGLREVVEWNPAAAYIGGVRALLLHATLPDARLWMWMAGLACVVPMVGVLVLYRLRSDLRDAL